ncbi:uncharacterized protein HMPREF1541_09030 [Cyphellophora europaea CBS 101466]|uniref:Uncharacterized protein n=1 Tax=Cyphellophora europaea (strain CBS 101466) TaxID=1220924 RepID=W2RJT9_CYPE1|nr:uncharacterized protein HMPREF1541_09030 [Cyphellophora europaea CBS 101466]ETN36752.1 hypothetical protein HMPREF1541_09030 [Cyphellophora europaea CBS 101466]
MVPNGRSCRRQPCGAGDLISCQERKRRCREHLTGRPQPDVERRLEPDVEKRNDRLGDNLEPDISKSTSLVVTQPPGSLPAPGGKHKRLPNATVQTSSAGGTPNQDQCDDRPVGSGFKPYRKRKHSNQELATVLVSVAMTGLQKLKLKLKPPGQGEQDNEMQTIISRRKEYVVGDTELDVLLQGLEAAFEKRGCVEKDNANPKVWHNWYYSACLRTILHWRGKWKNDRRTKSVGLLHQIVNKISVSRGAKALMVIQAYAEEDHRLSAPSRANAQDQDEISNLVVEALRPIMEHEEQKEGLVPFPAAWISRVTGISAVVRVHGDGTTVAHGYRGMSSHQLGPTDGGKQVLMGGE